MHTCHDDPEKCCCDDGYTYYGGDSVGQAWGSETCTGTDTVGDF